MSGIGPGKTGKTGYLGPGSVATEMKQGSAKGPKMGYFTPIWRPPWTGNPGFGTPNPPF